MGCNTPFNPFYKMKKLTSVLLLFLTVNSVYSQLGNALGDGALVQRPVKEAQFLYHYGVMVEGKVVHYNQTGLHISTLYEFSPCATIKVLHRGLTGEDLKQFRLRYNKIVYKYKNTKYDAVKNNCEHFVTELLIGTKRSFQSENAQMYVSTYWPVLREKC